MESIQNRRDKAEKLRKAGLSYREISQSLGIPKSTLSTWFAHATWSQNISSTNNTLRLINSTENLVTANRMIKRRRDERVIRFRQEAALAFRSLIHDPLFILGLGLYWGEGDKVDNGRVSVINTDPELIRIALDFYIRCLQIPKDKIRVGLFIYDDMKPNEILMYWSHFLDIPLNQFIKMQKLASRSTLTRRKSLYGICSLYFSSTEFSIKIHEWIRLLPTVRL